MKDGRRVCAIVPARGGTDRVPYLNVKRLGDRPLLAHTLAAALAAPSVDRVVVSTDDPGVAEIAREHGAEAPFLRPAELAGDIPSLKPVIVHAVRELEKAGDAFDLVLVLQATTPFRGPDAIEAALEALVVGGHDTVISVTADRTLNWREQDGALVPLFAREGRRDEQPPLFKENGAVVAMTRATVEGPTRFGERIGHVVLDKRAGFTVHDVQDFWMAERLLGQPRVLFRVDGSPHMGMGHVFRSLAIADALRENSRAEIAFLMSAERSEGIVAVTRHGYPVRAAAGGSVDGYLQHLRDYDPDVLINDLPRLDADYLRALAHLGATIVNLVDTPDDIETTEQYEQLVIAVMGQDRETPEGFYAGPAYAILREQFRGREKQLREAPRMLLLSFGGSDPQGLTLEAARALAHLPGTLRIVVVAGPAFAWRRELRALLPSLPRSFEVVHEAQHIAELMLEADLVVGSGGMSVYEIAALGTPGVVLAQNAKEDRRMREFARHGTIEYLGLGTEVGSQRLAGAVQALLDDPGRRRAMSERGRALVDGRGALRAAELVLDAQRQRVTNGETR